jgi:23S rRNA (cytosine1962-C5)-methyltransferase
MLDLCCNAGGFALQAAKHGARRVTAVDLDEVVLERAVQAGDHAGFDIEWLHRDIFHHLRDMASAKKTAQVVVLDPHKLVRGKASLEEGKKKYLDMNALALGAVSPGGILATFSCSGALDLPSFLGILFMAARRAERRLRILEILGAGPDHPQRPEFPRSRYLKGAVLAVD